MTARQYATPLAFKQALEQRLKPPLSDSAAQSVSSAAPDLPAGRARGGEVHSGRLES